MAALNPRSIPTSITKLRKAGPPVGFSTGGRPTAKVKEDAYETAKLYLFGKREQEKGKAGHRPLFAAALFRDSPCINHKRYLHAPPRDGRFYKRRPRQKN